MTQNETNRDKHITEASKQILRTTSLKYHIMHARYVFQLEDLFQCLQFNELATIFCVI